MMEQKKSYNSSVRVGNWFEDTCLEEGLLRDFIGKKERGELYIQKIQNILDTILKPTELSVTQDGFIHFGDKVMIINPGQEPSETPLTQLEPPRLAHSLSINAEEYTLFNDSFITSPCEVSASKLLNPCKRNTFVVTSVDGSLEGDKLCFGQPFALSTLPGYTGNMKLWSDHIHFNQKSKKSKSQLVRLLEDVSYLSVWNVLTLNHNQRLECEGLPVPANSKLVLHHCKTGQKLALMDQFKLRTPFGQDFEVSAQTTLNPHRAEVDQNHWVLVTGNPGDTKKTILNKVRKSILEDSLLHEQQEQEESTKPWVIDSKENNE